MASTDQGSRADAARIDASLAGLDALELNLRPRRRLASQVWGQVWPKGLAIAIFLLFWQSVVWSGWKPEYVLPSPWTAFDKLFSDFGDIIDAAGTTMGRAAQGFALRPGDRERARRARCPQPDLACRDRIDDHGPPDDAVDRVVPARRPAVQAHQRGDPLRGRARRGAVDRQRAHQWHRPDPAAAPARRSRARRAGSRRSGM